MKVRLPATGAKEASEFLKLYRCSLVFLQETSGDSRPTKNQGPLGLREQLAKRDHFDSQVSFFGVVVLHRASFSAPNLC